MRLSPLIHIDMQMNKKGTKANKGGQERGIEMKIIWEAPNNTMTHRK